MFKTTFNPGPSQISSEVKDDIREAIERKILEISHRSSVFNDFSKFTIDNIRKFFNVPNDYYVFYTSSATEWWELAIKWTVENNMFSFVNWNFSECFAKTCKLIWKNVEIDQVEWWNQNDFLNTNIPTSSEIITIVYNETSTWVRTDSETIKKIRLKYPEKIIAVDIVSIAWVKEFDINNADIWIFSVQKALWLPSWLWIMFVSQKAFEKSIYLWKKWIDIWWYFSFESMQKKMFEKCQTICTPNVLNIYLLWKQLDRFLNKWWVSELKKETLEKYDLIEKFVNNNNIFKFFVKDPKIRSHSVISLEWSEDNIKQAIEKCKTNWIIIWSWYGKIKPKTLRIANFPSIKIDELKFMLECL